ncbi:MAG: hypothetical protein P1U57_14210 [Oleibacter sp.]|nr:hypothetical protein [Thalassolituus sp.]
MSSNTTAKLSCRFFHIRDVSIPKLLEMHQVFSQYYHNADLATFIKDMSKKTGVFILKDKRANRIVGFSTYNEIEIDYRNRKAIGVFSGDTIVEKEFWGNRSMHKAFAMRMLSTKLKNPTTHVFWLLISKGYKTYLLMTNNFERCYPIAGKQDEELASLVDQYCTTLYPEAYNAEKRILDFGENYHALKDDVAEITHKMRMENRNIRYFDDTNPEWHRGTELPCVGEISASTLLGFIRKIFIGNVRLLPRRKQRANKALA